MSLMVHLVIAFLLTMKTNSCPQNTILLWMPINNSVHVRLPMSDLSKYLYDIQRIQIMKVTKTMLVIYTVNANFKRH